MIDLSYATGFLSGGFSETCATVSLCSYDPETNNNLELGWKADLLDRTLRLNSALYFTQYEDLQRAVVANYISSAAPQQERDRQYRFHRGVGCRPRGDRSPTQEDA